MANPEGHRESNWTIRRALAANLGEINEVIRASKSELLVMPEPEAEGFYERLGFRDTGRRVDSRVPGGPTFSVWTMPL